MTDRRTQVAIIGAGPAGLFLGQLLTLAGIDNIILEQKPRDYVLARIRAGILEQTTVDLARRAGAAARLDREGIPHHALQIVHESRLNKIGLPEFTDGKVVTAYGQTELTRDLCDARDEAGAATVYEAGNVSLHDFDTDTPSVSYEKDGVSHSLECDVIAGCDGYHGVSRRSVPDKAITIFEKIFPFGWLGLLADTRPVSEEVIYASTGRGFALCSMRSWTRSRYYVQCSADDHVDRWSDDAFWDELRRRLPQEIADCVETGPSIEKSIAPLRSFVAEPLRFGRLFLAGDAAHVVPPTGAKGLNLAASDIHYLSSALISWFQDNDPGALGQYSEKALSRIWKTERFSWWMTNLTHRFDGDPFDQRMKEAELSYTTSTETGHRMIAENYVGLPL